MGANGAHMSSYAKWALGWLSLDLKDSGVVINQYLPTALSEKNYGDSILAVKTIANDPNEFYLIELREYEDPYEGENGAVRDMVIIYKTTDKYEVQDAYKGPYESGNFYIDGCLDVVQWWWEPDDFFIDTYTGDSGFEVTISWYPYSTPKLSINVK